ncbi:Chaperone protein DnaK [Vibrio ruber DSM 16370]|uniref:Chaperone protein DnaK n=1 Tax=Vibrio ruber (strain DSM 16370 / JCM 11486 / BCRC 17186 / CECT 7878 / LMG 23124 / VR1) TaxID=1123498 RepID=A0A1R4LP59_VIBR1|nr:Hsp70 family protein [Vibrio ruber]SJN58305.1 Chaperone protein DnaK [Vibrio ruber DSM 16370]
MAAQHYLVGIDLGTTNTVVAYCDNGQDLAECPIRLFEIDQLIGPGEVARKPTLPSFRFHPAQGQLPPSDTALPWTHQPVDGDFTPVIIGEWARELGAQIEGRQVVSAKSWLSHPAVDRYDAILPWAGMQDVEKVSPLIASASYLNHIRQAWNYHHPAHPLEQQEIVVTVPASFDESARKLTLEAAALAGMPHVTLLEEPQAVCYDWYTRYQSQATTQLKDVSAILICDVGGGTTDLSLISASLVQDELKLDRVGVGEHLMLGGDNIDLALAHLAEQQFAQQHQGQPQKLSAARLSKLIQQTRKTKESLLAAQSPESAKITLLGSGSKLLGGTKSINLDKTQVRQMALDGFFPHTAVDTLPAQRKGAVLEFGLPYAADPAITKHIAAFLAQHPHLIRTTERPSAPLGLLLNGGVFNSDLIQQRLIQILSDWTGQPVTHLDNPHPDLAVALGSVGYLKACRGSQLKIGGGAARSYFLHLEQRKQNQSQALCLLAKGTEEGHEIRLSSRRFSLTLGEPVRFNLLTTRHDSLNGAAPIQSGQLIDVDPEFFSLLPPYITSLERTSDQALAANQKDRVEVFLSTQLTPVGTLKLECVQVDDEQHRWQLEFEVRHQSHQQNDASSETSGLTQASELITALYSGNKNSAIQADPRTLSKSLTRLLGEKDHWDIATNRQLFDRLAQGKKRRRRSEAHEKNWLRFAGFTMRPGFGDPVDSWRIEQIWSLYQQGIQFQTHQTWSDWWTFWRRVCGGLNQEQQETILADIAKYLHPGAHNSSKQAKAAQEKGYEAMVRLAASLEHLEPEDKILLGNWFIKRALRQPQYAQAHWWAVGRLASRVLLYGSRHKVIPQAQLSHWLAELLQQDWKQEPMIGFAAMMMSRKTGDRQVDITDDLRTAVTDKLKQSKAPQSWLTLIDEISQVCESDSKRIFGETLPSGLRLLH